jgi:hypothetical protein
MLTLRPVLGDRTRSPQHRASSGVSVRELRGALIAPRQYAENLNRNIAELLDQFPTSIIVVDRRVWFSGEY